MVSAQRSEDTRWDCPDVHVERHHSIVSRSRSRSSALSSGVWKRSPGLRWNGTLATFNGGCSLPPNDTWTDPYNTTPPPPITGSPDPARGNLPRLLTDERGSSSGVGVTLRGPPR